MNPYLDVDEYYEAYPAELRKFEAAVHAAGLWDTVAGLFEWHAPSKSWMRVSDPFVVEVHHFDARGRHQGSILSWAESDTSHRMSYLSDRDLSADARGLTSWLRAEGLYVEHGKAESLVKFVKICRASFGALSKSGKVIRSPRTNRPLQPYFPN